ncbi:hypothetical protein F4818DRAFT_454186 [Hypoxylon cercidicola]|nr:hypothetical protein F4818DRAFT_454186 [Hypoxylon cercidicola]
MANQPAPPPFDGWVLERLISLRGTMEAWAWEHALLNFQQLESLRSRPCDSSVDDRLLVLTRDWIRPLQELSNRELMSPGRQIVNRDRYTFSQLLFLVCRLYELVCLFHLGYPHVRRTPDHHRTFWLGCPRSDVAQARLTISVLAFRGFGSWLESCIRGVWGQSTDAMVHSFAFNPRTRLLCWVDRNEGRYPNTPLPRLALNLVIPDPAPYNQEHESREEVTPTPEQSSASFGDLREGICQWLDNITDSHSISFATMDAISFGDGTPVPSDKGGESDDGQSSEGDGSNVESNNGDLLDFLSEGIEGDGESRPTDGMSVSTEREMRDDEDAGTESTGSDSFITAGSRETGYEAEPDKKVVVRGILQDILAVLDDISPQSS